MRSLLPPAPGDLDDASLEAAYGGQPSRHVRANFVTAVDGAVELDGRSAGLGGPADRRVFAVLRGLCDVVLVGAGTARREDYRPARIPPPIQARRLERGQQAVPPIAVVTRSGQVDLSARLFGPAQARPLVVTCRTAPIGPVGERADVIVAGETQVDLRLALDLLAERGLGRVLCEGGPALLGSLLAGGLLDELCLTVAPLVAGPGRATLSGGPHRDLPARLQLAQLLEDDGLLFTRYRVAGRGEAHPGPPDTAAG